jgi:hypothetical protein
VVINMGLSTRCGQLNHSQLAHSALSSKRTSTQSTQAGDNTAPWAVHPSQSRVHTMGNKHRDALQHGMSKYEVNSCKGTHAANKHEM